MKIGILCYPTSGGSGVIASELGMALAARGHEVHLFSYRSPFRLRPHSDNFQWHEITIPQYPLFEYPSYGMAAACRVAEVELDVLHCHYAYPHAVSAFLAKEMTGQKLKTVTTLHGTDILLVGQDASFTRATKFGLERSDAITAVSAFLRDKTLSWFDVSPKIHVIPDFVDARRFSPTAGPRESTIVHVSNFRPVKRTADAVRALYLIRRRVPATLVLVGTGPEKEAVRELAGRLGILSSVRFIGEDPEVEAHLRTAGLALSTSEFEGFGMSVLEAMACGVPVVATESGGVSEVLSEACGRTASVGDVEALAAAAVEILRDQNLARTMGEAGRRRAEELFDVDRVVPQYEALYERVCGASNAENLSV
ncbi:MAG TPA: N-acetyl-alpha-D-glucosaminyl L-malate synthase BshA [Planctomycetota bacterium]|nr:N-acetyl-alpha-D-glucosaminyl L-malate synthase BshA [Planctomycetota bacterium]